MGVVVTVGCSTVLARDFLPRLLEAAAATGGEVTATVVVDISGPEETISRTATVAIGRGSAFGTVSVLVVIRLV